MGAEKLTRAQRRILETAARAGGFNPHDGREANTVERLERRHLLHYSPGYGPSFDITEAGRAALEDRNG